MFGYLKTPNVILFLVSSQKLDWTHTFDTHCILGGGGVRSKKIFMQEIELEKKIPACA